MNHNIGVQTTGVRAWDGTNSFPRDIRKHNYFGFVFEVIAPIVVDAVFSFQWAPPSDVDPCVPGDFEDVEAIPTCAGEILTPGELAMVTIPGGTTVGTICAGTLPCRPGSFVQIISVSGDTDSVFVTMLLQGPHLV